MTCGKRKKKTSFGAFARMKSFNSVLSTYGYDLEFIIFFLDV